MKKIILIIVLIIIFTGTGLVSATGIVKIPVFSDIFYREKISDLGIETDSGAAERLEQKLGVLRNGLLDIATKQVPLPRAVPGDIIAKIEITDKELSSWVNLTCLDLVFFAPCPFENFQIRFLEGKYISSVRILKPFDVNITVFGSISRKDETSIDLEIERVYVGNLRMPFIGNRLEREAEAIINKNLGIMGNLRIGRLEILEGRMVFEGVLDPRELSNLLDQGIYYTPVTIWDMIPGFDMIPGVDRISRREAEKLAVINWRKDRATIPENRVVGVAERERGYWLVTIQIINMFTGEIVSKNAGQYKVDKTTGRIREYKGAERIPRVPEKIEKPHIKEENLIRAEKLSRDAQRKAGIRQIATAMEMFYFEREQYLQLKTMPTSIGVFMDQIPKDPSGTPYYWLDNTPGAASGCNTQHYCAWVALEQGGYFAASDKGTKELLTAPVKCPCW